ncbi:hypothetical protein PCAR4_350062 [Paraburkholderia caribensis]|nr:hypothetical protein PCAR4_350062 [Paraburkholderia caribensis]
MALCGFVTPSDRAASTFNAVERKRSSCADVRGEFQKFTLPTRSLSSTNSWNGAWSRPTLRPVQSQARIC